MIILFPSVLPFILELARRKIATAVLVRNRGMSRELCIATITADNAQTNGAGMGWFGVSHGGELLRLGLTLRSLAIVACFGEGRGQREREMRGCDVIGACMA